MLGMKTFLVIHEPLTRDRRVRRGRGLVSLHSYHFGMMPCFGRPTVLTREPEVLCIERASSAELEPTTYVTPTPHR
jgi:hypothetical protein